MSGARTPRGPAKPLPARGEGRRGHLEELRIALFGHGTACTNPCSLHAPGAGEALALLGRHRGSLYKIRDVRPYRLSGVGKLDVCETPRKNPGGWKTPAGRLVWLFELLFAVSTLRHAVGCLGTVAIATRGVCSTRQNKGFPPL